MNYLKIWTPEQFVDDYKYTSSGHFFDKDTMRFFKSRMTSIFKFVNDTTYLFVTSEKKCFNDYTRVFTVRIATQYLNEDGFRKYSIRTLDNGYQLSRYAAKKLVREYKE